MERKGQIQEVFRMDGAGWNIYHHNWNGQKHDFLYLSIIELNFVLVVVLKNVLRMWLKLYYLTSKARLEKDVSVSLCPSNLAIPSPHSFLPLNCLLWAKPTAMPWGQSGIPVKSPAWKGVSRPNSSYYQLASHLTAPPWKPTPWSPQMTPGLSLGVSICGCSHYRAQTSCLCCAFAEFLTHGNWER